MKVSCDRWIVSLIEETDTGEGFTLEDFMDVHS